MPNYDIIPLATDLLDYTIQRVKVKEPQYTKVKAYVMENGQMVEKELFEKIKDDGKPHFPKSQTFHMCADMQRMASAILQKCNSADGRYFETEYEKRLKDLDEVIVLCDTLNQYINLSYKRKYISGDQCHYWAELVRPVRQKAFNWKRNDSNRAAALREAKVNQELAKMGQMAQQICAVLLFFIQRLSALRQCDDGLRQFPGGGQRLVVGVPGGTYLDQQTAGGQILVEPLAAQL